MSVESAAWKQKFEGGEGNVKPEEVEEIKKKLLARSFKKMIILEFYYRDFESSKFQD